MGANFDYIRADRHPVKNPKYKVVIDYDGKHGARVSVCKQPQKRVEQKEECSLSVPPPPPPPFFDICKATYVEVLFARNRLKKINKTINQLIADFEKQDDQIEKEEFYI